MTILRPECIAKWRDEDFNWEISRLCIFSFPFEPYYDGWPFLRVIEFGTEKVNWKICRKEFPLVIMKGHSKDMKTKEDYFDLRNIENKWFSAFVIFCIIIIIIEWCWFWCPPAQWMLFNHDSPIVVWHWANPLLL